MKDKTNDNELIYSVREIGSETKEVIFKKYEPIIRKISQDKYRQQWAFGVDVEDFVQEGFIGLNKAIDCYNPKTKTLFYTYACLCIKRQIHSYIRKFYREKEIKDYKYYEEEDSYCLVGESNEKYLLHQCHHDEVINLKNKIPFLESCVFELRYNGFSYKEISKLLEVTEKDIDRYLYRFRKLLKEREINKILN